MRIPRIQAIPQSDLPFGEETKPGFRTKTAATRLTPGELTEIESAAGGAGQPLSEWLRARPLCAPRGSGPPILSTWCWLKSGRCVMPY